MWCWTIGRKRKVPDPWKKERLFKARRVSQKEDICLFFPVPRNCAWCLVCNLLFMFVGICTNNCLLKVLCRLLLAFPSLILSSCPNESQLSSLRAFIAEQKGSFTCPDCEKKNGEFRSSLYNKVFMNISIIMMGVVIWERHYTSVFSYCKAALCVWGEWIDLETTCTHDCVIEYTSMTVVRETIEIIQFLWTLIHICVITMFLYQFTSVQIISLSHHKIIFFIQGSSLQSIHTVRM